MFRDTNSHGLISVQFICALGVFFGVNIEIIQINISELYQNLSYETLSGAKDFEYNSISDIVTELSYQIKTSTLQNRKRQREDDIRQMKKLIMTIVFLNQLTNLIKNWWTVYLNISNIKNLNIPTLNGKFRTLN